MRHLNVFGVLLAGALTAGLLTAQQNDSDPAVSNGINAQSTALTALGSLVAGPFDVETAPFDNRCLGVEEMGGFLWVTGGGHTSTGWAYMVHQYDMNGVYLQSWPQVSNTTAWGGRDMVSNGNTLYIGSDNAEVSQYSWNGVALSHVSLTTVPGVSGTVRAFTQNPNTGNFFTKSFTGTFYEFTLTGVVNSVVQTALSAYGFGWDDVNGTIWSTTTGPSVQEVDTSCNFLSGSFGNTWGTAQGGADVYSDSRNPGFLSMVVLGQGTPDSVEVYDLGVPSGVGFTLSLSGLVAGGSATISVSGATAGGLVRHGYSLRGGGPTTTPWGNLLLTPPYTELPAMTADGAGNASLSATVPAGTTGVNVWLHAFDLGSLTFSNGVNQAIG